MMRIPIMRGRDIDERDVRGGLRVMVVSEALAKPRMAESRSDRQANFMLRGFSRRSAIEDGCRRRGRRAHGRTDAGHQAGVLRPNRASAA